MKKSQEDLKGFPQDTIPPKVIPDEAEPREDWETEEPEGRARPESDWEELPEIIEETKVVLLPVNPSLVYVYWQIASPEREEVARVFSRLGPRAQPVLRFHAATQASPEGSNAANWFDAEIALGTGNWYVHLEKPAKAYWVDLGLRSEGSGFHRLARSNVAEIPRGGPSEKSEESYLDVASEVSQAEAVVVPGEGSGASRRGLTIAEPQGGDRRWREGGEASRTAPAYHERQLGEGNEWEDKSVLRRAPVATEPQCGERDWREGTDVFESGPFYDALRGQEEIGQEPENAKSFCAATPAEMERKLAESYPQRKWEGPWFAPGTEGGEEPQLAGSERADLTEVTERSFRAGLSSGQKLS